MGIRKIVKKIANSLGYDIIKLRFSRGGGHETDSQLDSLSQARIIAEIISGCGYESYLELGIYYGATYKHIRPFVKKAAAVDIEYKEFIPLSEFFHMTTDEFFSQNETKYDVVFIDALHEYFQVKKDFENAFKCLKQGGTIFLHDTDPYSEKYLGPSFCADSYKMNDYLLDSADYQYVTIPMDKCGLTIVRRIGDNRYTQFV